MNIMWKEISELTASDLSETPVWEFSENGSRGLVRPTTLRELSEYYEGPVYVVATTFLLNNGQRRNGYCSPAENSGLDYTQPVIFTPDGQVPLWNEELPSDVHMKQLAERLDVSPSEVFPITLTSLVPVEGTYYAETVET